MESQFRGRNILITGGTGAFGLKFVNYLSQHSPAKVTVISRDEMKHAAMKRVCADKTKYAWLNYQIADICRDGDLELVAQDADIIIHAAAMKHLPECEVNVKASNFTNVIGTQNVVKVFQKSKAETLVFLSTDKAPYASSVYGAQKYIGEKLISEAAKFSTTKRAFNLRYSNVIDSTGAVFLIFANMLTSGKKVSVNGTQTMRGFVTQAEVIAILEASMKNLQGGETVVVKPRVIKIAELAICMREIIAKGEVEIKDSTAFLGEKDNATLIMAEELEITKDFPEADVHSYILDNLNRHKERRLTHFGFEGAYTLDHCPVVTGNSLKEFLMPVMKANNIL